VGAQVFSFSIPETRASSPLAVNILGHVDIRVTPFVPHNLRPCGLAQHMAGMHGAEGPKMLPLLVESAGSESPQTVASIRGQIGMRVCTCEICHRRAYASVHRG
jgi:hypothetical protein